MTKAHEGDERLGKLLPEPFGRTISLDENVQCVSMSTPHFVHGPAADAGPVPVVAAALLALHTVGRVDGEAVDVLALPACERGGEPRPRSRDDPPPLGCIVGVQAVSGTKWALRRSGLLGLFWKGLRSPIQAGFSTDLLRVTSLSAELLHRGPRWGGTITPNHSDKCGKCFGPAPLSRCWPRATHGLPTPGRAGVAGPKFVRKCEKRPFLDYRYWTAALGGGGSDHCVFE